MQTSDAGLTALEHREGVKLVMYRDAAGLPTIGVGHLLTKDELLSGKVSMGDAFADWHRGLTDEQVRALLRQDVAAAEGTINAAVTVALTQSQFDSLVSFRFNIGGTAFRNSTLLKKLNAGLYADVPQEMRRWVFSAGQRDPILVRRREDEIAQWESA